MIEITKSREVRAPVERVWPIVADMENEHKPWPALGGVKILNKTESSLQREVTVRRGPMGEGKSSQTLVIDPGGRRTTLTMTKGTMLGTRTIVLGELGKDRTGINVVWKFETRGVPSFALGFVTDGIAAATEKALARIAEEASRLKIRS